jgi:hypothetical protein
VFERLFPKFDDLTIPLSADDSAAGHRAAWEPLLMTVEMLTYADGGEGIDGAA